MREFADLYRAGNAGAALQRVHGAPQRAREPHVAGRRLPRPQVAADLRQQFRRLVEEHRQHLGVEIVGERHACRRRGGGHGGWRQRRDWSRFTRDQIGRHHDRLHRRQDWPRLRVGKQALQRSEFGRRGLRRLPCLDIAQHAGKCGNRVAGSIDSARCRPLGQRRQMLQP